MLSMRLTIVNQYYVPDISPTAHLSASLAEHRAKLGDDVTVVTSRGGYIAEMKDSQATAIDSPKVYRVWTPRLSKASIVKRTANYLVFYFAATWRMLTLPRQDVIISLTTPPFIAFTGVLHKLLHPQTRLVLWNMDCYPEVAERTNVIRVGGFLSRVMRWLNRRLFRRLDHLVVLDEAMRELLISQYADPESPVASTEIPNWENESLFPREIDPPDWEEVDRLGLRDQFVILYLGNAGYGHRFDTVLRAAKQLESEPVKFLFVGGGRRYAEIERQRDELQLKNFVIRGYVPKEVTPSVLKAANCALITMADFALGVISPSKLHSNLAMRLPIIYVGPAGSNVDVAIQRYDCGVSIRHEDSDSLVAFIRRFLADDEFSQSMRGKARDAFEQAYCDRQTLRQFDNVLAQLSPAASPASVQEAQDVQTAP